MKEVLQKKTLFVVIPLLIALLSVFVLSGPASSPDLHGSTLAALEEKQTTVLELSAASAAASAAITLIPGDVATPIADKLADLSSHFLLVLCAVFLEKYLTSVRHVEMQVLADAFGNIVCLGERDCSLQLNKQKVLEETPCPVMTEDIRKRMMDAAVKAAKAANYVNAGTVEFLLAPDGNFYFIEMNTRLQVEHPITEEISDVDIVKWQIRIACQIPLDFTQEDIHLHGCLLYTSPSPRD